MLMDLLNFRARRAAKGVFLHSSHTLKLLLLKIYYLCKTGALRALRALDWSE